MTEDRPFTQEEIIEHLAFLMEQFDALNTRTLEDIKKTETEEDYKEAVEMFKWFSETNQKILLQLSGPSGLILS